MDDLNEFFCRLRACIALLCRRIDQMLHDVILDHFGDDAVQRTTTLHSSHMSLLSHPKEVATVIEKAASTIAATAR
jgi:hypothetical protein